MQKSGVKTLSIIDTLSELAHDETEASRLALPSPISVQRGSGNRLSSSRISISGVNSSIGPPLPPGSIRGVQPPPIPPSLGHPPQLQPRNPKVSVPMLSPGIVNSPDGDLNVFGGAKPRFVASSPNRVAPPEVSPRFRGLDGVPVNGHRSGITLHSNGSSPQTNGLRAGSLARHPGVTTPKKSSKVRLPGSRGQTPDWIRDIFVHAKGGNSEKLASALEGLEPTLIRNLTDHLGNNLLHVICSHGHAHILPWLTVRFGSELADGLNDENRSGISPTLAAIKRGRLECLEWLVHNTNCVRDRMSSSTCRDSSTGQSVNGGRCLLHEAAKYGKAEIVDWLSEELERQQLDVDQLDNAGNSPLHLAMKRGNIPTVSTLLHHGAKIHLKNNMGLNPGDCARLMGRRHCAEYLLLYETSLAMSRELREVQSKNEQLQNEQAELRGHFKELLTVGKRLSKERDEMSRELGKLQESVMELHDKLIMEIQVLTQENYSLRKNGYSKQDEDQNSSSTIDECTTLHERWRQYHRQWFYASLTDSEQKLVLADEVFRKTRNGSTVHNNNNNNNSSHILLNDEAYPQRKLRDRIEEMRGRVTTPLINRSGSILFSSSDDEDEDDDEDGGNVDLNDVVDGKNRRSSSGHNGSQRRITPDISRRKKMPTPTPSLEDSVYSSLSNEMYSKIGSPSSKPSPKQSPMSPEERRRESRDALRTKLRECALVSESGSASVIEVIEPTSSEEEEFERSLRQLNLGWNIESKNSSTRNSKRSDFAATPEIGTNSSGRNSQTGGKEFDLLEEHFVDESSFDDLMLNGENRQQRRTKKKSNFLQKIGLKATKWSSKKSPIIPRRETGRNNESVDNNSLGCSPLVYANVSTENVNEIEEHVLPDSFDDENFFSSTNNADNNVDLKVDISAIRRKFENNGDENNHLSTNNSSSNNNNNENNNQGDLSTRCNASLSPSSRKSMLHSGSSYRSSTTSAVSANSASANSVAASEDSGIVVTQPRPTSSASGKPSREEGDPPSPPTSFYDNNNSNNSNDFFETKLKGLTTSDYVIRQNHLGKIEEAASPVASSRCSSTTGHNGTRVAEVKPSESVRSKSRPGAAIRRRDSSLKAWYDVPSDEDPDAPEADSLASIISHRSSSEEDF